MSTKFTCSAVLGISTAPAALSFALAIIKGKTALCRKTTDKYQGKSILRRFRKIIGRTGEPGFKKTIRCLVVVSVCLGIHLVLMTDLVWSDTLSGQSIVISESRFGRNNDDQNWKIEILLEQGERHADNEPWCGNGEKWEGYFSIQVKKGNTLLSKQSLNKLMFPDEKEPGPLSFWTPKFPLVLNDYNMDGQTDLNIGQYGSCNGNYYKLFTVNPDGVISLLPVKDTAGLFVTGAQKQNSTNLIRTGKGLLIHRYYDNTAGKYFTVHYKWYNKQFMPVRKVVQ